MRNTVGRWVAASLIKAVPGAGTVIGGAVSAAAAEQRHEVRRMGSAPEGKWEKVTKGIPDPLFKLQNMC